MKRLIDIHKLMKKVFVEECCGNNLFVVNATDIQNAPTVLTIPDNPTNGDMIKAIFPDVTISRVTSKCERYKIAVEWNFEKKPYYYIFFDEEFWNAPYKENE